MINSKIAALFVIPAFLLFLLINIPSPVAVRGDGVFYYGWLHSVVFDHDINLSNQLEYFSQYDFYSDKFTREKILTVTEHSPNPYAFGTAILWGPFVLFAHGFNAAANFFGCDFFDLNGYSAIYVFSVNFASWFFGMVSVLIIYKMLLYYFDAKTSIFAIIGLWLATPWVYYQFFEPSMSHAASLMMISVFLLSTIRVIHDQKVSCVALGVIVFLMISVRWQNILFIFAALPLLSYYNSLFIKRVFVVVTIFAMGAFFLLQSIAWKIVYGAYILIPQGSDFVGRSFYFLDTIFSTNRGLLVWSPIFICALAGIYYLFKKDKYIAISCVMAFIFQWFLNSVLSDPGGGDAFGGRRFIGVIPFLALSLGAFAEKVWSKKVVVALVFLIFWNIILMQNYRINNIPHHGKFDVFNIEYFDFIGDIF